MNYYSFPDKKAWKIFIQLLLAALLLLCRDGLYMTVLGFYPCMFAFYALAGILGIAFLAVNVSRLKEILTDRRLLVMLLSTVVMLLPMLIKKDWQLMYMNILLGIYIAILFIISVLSSYRK